MDNPRIKIISKDLKGQTFELTRDQYLVGRTEECDICIPVSAVSSRHCTLTRMENGDYLLTDLNSTNGTVVNGSKIQEKELRHSDIIRMGSIEVIYESPVKHRKKEYSATSSQSQKSTDLRQTAGTNQITDFYNFSPFGSNKSSIYRGIGRNWRVIGIGLLAGLTLVILVVLFHLVAGLLT